MEYSVNGLAALSGITKRTLRYYDQIGLLAPQRISSSGYRIYAQAQVDRLQQILLYREMGFELSQIAKLLSGDRFDPYLTLRQHLAALQTQRSRLDILIDTVQNSIAAIEGRVDMKDKEKFNGFKQKIVEESETKYGKEAREKYGATAVDASNAKIIGMSEEVYKAYLKCEQELAETLKKAVQTGDPAGESAQKACALHKQWLLFLTDRYSKEYHRALAEMYVTDERFTAYYEAIAPGAAAFLKEAILVFCKE